MHPNVKIVTTYLEVLDPNEFLRTLERTVAALRTRDFDAIAFCGMSGAVLAPSVAQALGKTLLLVRKSSEVRHSSYTVEGDCGANTYVILDDLICTGETVRHIQRQIQTAQCVGIYTYASLFSNWMDIFIMDKIPAPQSPSANALDAEGVATLPAGRPLPAPWRAEPWPAEFTASESSCGCEFCKSRNS